MASTVTGEIKVYRNYRIGQKVEVLFPNHDGRHAPKSNPRKYWRWLPAEVVGVRESDLSIAAGCVRVNLGSSLGHYSIPQDRIRTEIADTCAHCGSENLGAFVCSDCGTSTLRKSNEGFI